MVITLTSDIEQALAEQARDQGVTPEHLALESLRRAFVPAAELQPTDEAKETLADFLGNFIGVLHSGEHGDGGAGMSQNTGEKFTEVLIEKRRQGRA